MSQKRKRLQKQRDFGPLKFAHKNEAGPCEALLGVGFQLHFAWFNSRTKRLFLVE